MNIRLAILSFLFAGAAVAQQVSGVYKINDLLRRISQPDTAYVVNFWATWCKPCIQELPAFDSLYAATRNQPVTILLVSLDFKEELDKKVNPFLKKNNMRVECVLLDEVNGNDFINKISPQWSGALPGSLFNYQGKTLFAEKKMTLRELQANLAGLTK